MNDDVSTPPVQLPDVSSTDKMIYLLLTPKLFGSAITAAIQSGVLHHRVTPDMVCVRMCVDVAWNISPVIKRFQDDIQFCYIGDVIVTL